MYFLQFDILFFIIIFPNFYTITLLSGSGSTKLQLSIRSVSHDNTSYTIQIISLHKTNALTPGARKFLSLAH